MKKTMFVLLFLISNYSFAFSPTITTATEQLDSAVETKKEEANTEKTVLTPNPTLIASTVEQSEIEKITHSMKELNQANLSDGASFILIWKTIMPDLLKIAANIWSIIAGGLIILIGCPFFYNISKKAKAAQIHVEYENKTFLNGLFSWKTISKEDLIFSQDDTTESQTLQLVVGYVGLALCTVVGLFAIL